MYICDAHVCTLVCMLVFLHYTYTTHKKGNKRKREDGSTLLSETQNDEVDEDTIIGYVSRKKMTKEERMASIYEGREGRGKYGASKDKAGGSTNADKIRNKPFMLTKHSGKVRAANSNKTMASTQSKQQKHIKTLQRYTNVVWCLYRFFFVFWVYHNCFYLY